MAKARKKTAKNKTARRTTRKKVSKKAARTKKTTRKKALKKKTAGRKTKARKKAPTKKKKTRKTAKKRVSPRKNVTKKKTKKKASQKKTAKKVRPKKKKAAKKKTLKKKKTTRKKTVKKTLPKKKNLVSMNNIPVFDLEKYEIEEPIETGIKDTFFGSTRYAWIGTGQCGGRLVRAFYELGYRKAIALNTAKNDLDSLILPPGQKYLMAAGSKGAGKDMELGQNAAKASRQAILHLADQIFGDQFDHIMVCVGAGGGTGGGSAVELVKTAKKYARSVGKIDPDRSVGVVMTLPTIGEAGSAKVAENAFKVACDLGKMAAKGRISPLIIIDNEKINRMYPSLTVKDFWPTINSTVAGLFDVFNRLSHLSSPYTSFDPADYRSIIRAGGCAVMGLTKVNEYADRFAMSRAVKNNIKKTLLSEGLELKSAKAAGSIAVGGKSMMATTAGLQDNIDYAFDVLADITGDAVVHRGIYEDQRESLRVYTIIGGLDFPMKRVRQLIER